MLNNFICSIELPNVISNVFFEFKIMASFLFSFFFFGKRSIAGFQTELEFYF